ncbi:iron chelate uptake ABC transporter family permease subunit [Streptomyces sp. NPDC049555]|uniref:FecCD family ABC transporter permease n=1 Tax=Streptomyces sp. NPDC049555 TaxID=3154930 RepID=UPI003427D07C
MTATQTPRPPRVLRAPGGLSVRLHPRSALVVVLLLACALAASVVLIGSGDYPMEPGDVLRTLTGGGTGAQEFIVRELRLPRVVVGLLAGAALGLAGAVFQSVTRNPLGSPDVLGLAQGATTGALLVIVLRHGDTASVAAGAAAGGLAAGAAIYALAWRKGVHGYRFVLVGVGVAAVLTALIGYLLTKAGLTDAARATVWMVGSLTGRGWEQVWPLLGACTVLVPLALGHGRSLRMLEMGDDTAYALGVRVERVRIGALGTAVLLTTAATAAAGPIAFVALAAPQLARRLTRAPGPNLLAATCTGAALLTGADLAAQRLFGADRLPVGAFTGTAGGCYLLWLLFTERRAGRI